MTSRRTPGSRRLLQIGARSIACGVSLLAPLAFGSAHSVPPLPPALVAVGQILTAPQAHDPALAVLPGGIAATRSDLLRWINDAGGSPRDFDTADTATRREMICAFVDDLDLGMEQLAMPRSASSDMNRIALWHDTLMQAAYRDLVDPANVDDSLRTPAVRIARLQAAMAAIGPRASDIPIDRFAADPRLDPALLLHAVTSGLAASPAVEDQYRRALFASLAQDRRRSEVAVAAVRYAASPTIVVDPGRTAGTGARSACLPNEQSRLTFAAAQRANAQAPFLAQSVTLHIRRRSRSIVAESMWLPGH